MAEELDPLPQPGATPAPGPAPSSSPAAPLAAAAEPAPSAEPESKPADVDAVEVGGERYVPLSALLAERNARKEAAEKAAKVDALEQYQRQAQPYIDFLKANPHVLQQQKPQPEPAKPSADPDALEAAKLMDFYQSDGQPDMARGAKWLELQDRRAARVADQRMQPLAQLSARDRSQQNLNFAAQIKDPEGNTPSLQSLQTIWAAMPAEYTADPNVASVLAVTALGLDRMGRKPGPKPPSQGPVVTESLGAAPSPRAILSELDRRVIAQRGLTEEKWQERTKGFKAGRPSPLED